MSDKRNRCYLARSYPANNLEAPRDIRGVGVATPWGWVEICPNDNGGVDVNSSETLAIELKAGNCFAVNTTRDGPICDGLKDIDPPSDEAVKMDDAHDALSALMRTAYQVSSHGSWTSTLSDRQQIRAQLESIHGTLKKALS